MANKRRQRCIYCQRRPATEMDHVPPKGLFPKPKPPTLVTVPACGKCNRGSSKDDEYFRLVVPSRHDVGDNKYALKANDTALRGIARPKSAGFKRAFLKTVEEVDLVTPSGLFVGRGLRMQPDYYRIEDVVRRTVRGLYYHTHDKTPLPPDCPIWVASDIGFEGSKGDDLVKQKQFFEKLLATPPQIVHEDIFSYWTQDVKDQDFMSVWFLLFYKKIWFVAFTNTPDSPESPA